MCEVLLKRVYLQLSVPVFGFPLDIEFQCHWELPLHYQHIVVYGHQVAR